LQACKESQVTILLEIHNYTDINQPRSTFIVANILKDRTFVRVFYHGGSGFVYTRLSNFYTRVSSNG
jgi:hypothetical protein